MWYEILPSVGVIFAAMTFGGAAATFVPKLMMGNTPRRVQHPYEFEYYLRDYQLTRNVYALKGLETIPDPEDAKSQK